MHFHHSCCKLTTKKSHWAWSEVFVGVVQLLKSCLALYDPMSYTSQALLSSTVSWSLLRFMSIESVMLSYHLILFYPLLLLPSIFSSIRVFSNESALCIRWSKYWSFSFSIKIPVGGHFPFWTQLFLRGTKGSKKYLSPRPH